MRRFTGSALAVGLALALQSLPVRAQAAPAEAIAWARQAAVPAGSAETPLSPAEAKAVSAIIGDARVVGFGELMHGAEEPLAYRNRLIRHLVAHEGFTLVTLETGIAGARRLDAYVQGGEGKAEELVQTWMNWSFGTLAANAELLEWLRAWNATPGNRRVQLLGADTSGGDGKSGMSGARLPLDDLAAWLATAAPEQSAPIRATLAAVAPSFSSEGYATLSTGERAQLTTALADAKTLVRKLPPSADREWALRMAEDGLALAGMLALWPAPGDPSQVPALMKLSRIRDRAMADHLLWALDRQGKGARAISFAANGHVSPALVDVRIAEMSEPGGTMGAYLKEALGTSYRVIITASDGASPQLKGPPLPPDLKPVPATAATLDPVLKGAGPAPFWLPLAGARPADWWTMPQTIAAFQRQSRFDPRTIDAILVLPPLTPARQIGADGGRTGQPR